MARYEIGKEWNLRMNGKGGRWEAFACVKANSLYDAIHTVMANDHGDTRTPPAAYVYWTGDKHRYGDSHRPGDIYWTVRRMAKREPSPGQEWAC